MSYDLLLRRMRPKRSMFDIEITDSQEHLTLDPAFLREVVETTLGMEEVAAATVSLAFIDYPAIHELNRRFLDHDDPTDVLSFLLESEVSHEHSEANDDRPGRGLRLEGEVIVSTETATRAATEFLWNPLDEVTLYVVHGLLHLVGYDDHADADRQRMRDRERAVLQTWGLTPHYSESTAACSDSVSKSETGDHR